MYMVPHFCILSWLENRLIRRRPSPGRIAANLGKVSGNPFAVDTRCPCCEKAFRADRMWFYGCHVVLRRLPPNADLVFDVAGAEMRVVELNHDNREADCISFAAT